MTTHKHSLATFMAEGVTTLTEARRKNIKYVESSTKGVVSSVIAELSEDSNKEMQEIALQYVRLDKQIDKLTKSREDMKDQLKTFTGELFDAEDAILTRVAQIGRFALQLSKETTSSKPVVNYDAVVQELQKGLIPELRAKLDELIALNTTDKVTTTAARFTIKDDGEKTVTPNLKEGLVDQVLQIIQKFVNSVLSWAKKFDRPLHSLVRRAGFEKSVLTESIEKVEDAKKSEDDKSEEDKGDKQDDAPESDAGSDKPKDDSDEDKKSEESEEKKPEDKEKHDDIDTDGLNADDAGVQKYLDALEVVKEMATDNEDIKEHLTRSLATIMAAIPAQQAAEADVKSGEAVDGEPDAEGAEVVDDADTEKVDGAEDTKPEDDAGDVEKVEDSEKEEKTDDKKEGEKEEE